MSTEIPILPLNISLKAGHVSNGPQYVHGYIPSYMSFLNRRSNLSIYKTF